MHIRKLLRRLFPASRQISVTCRWDTIGETPTGPVIAVKFSGVYPRGADGKQVADAMIHFLDSALAETRAAGVIFDMTELDYTEGGAIRGLWTPLDSGGEIRPTAIVAAGDTVDALRILAKPSARVYSAPMRRFRTIEDARTHIMGVLNDRVRRLERQWADGSPVVYEERPTVPPPIPDTSTQWKLWYSDSFDREAPDSIEAKGTNILIGLYELWKRTITQAIDDDGKATFSDFYLTWGDEVVGVARSGVHPFDNSTLLKLKRRAATRGEDALLKRLAELHLGFLQKRETADAAREMLKHIDGISDPDLSIAAAE